MNKFLLLIFFLLVGCSKKLSKNISQINGSEHKSHREIVLIDEILDLKGSLWSIESKELRFSDRGKIINGTILGQNSLINAPSKKIFESIQLEGNWIHQEGYLEWFLGDKTDVAEINFLYLTLLLRHEFAVKLNKMIPIGLKFPKDMVRGIRNIHLKGSDSKTCGLLLITKNENLFYNYFQSDEGCNVKLENLTIKTQDYQQGLRTEKESEYFLFGTYYQGQFNPNARPSIDSIILKDCHILGNVGMANFGSHSKNQSIAAFGSTNKIGKLKVENCRFDNVNSPFSFSNMGYDSIFIRNNVIQNFSSAFLSIPESGLEDVYYEPLRKNKIWVEFTGNQFSNDRVVKVPKERILSPCVIKGGNSSMLFQNNTLTNLLSDAPDADVHTFYFTCEDPGYFKVINNTIRNVVGRGSVSHPASLIKQRWASTFILENNEISLDVESLVKIGVLKSPSENLSSLDGNRFYYEFMQVGGQTTLQKKFYIRHNKFSMPFVNKSTEIYDAAEFILQNNNFHISFFGPSHVKSSVSEDNTLFLGRQRLDVIPGKNPGKFISSENKFIIDQTGEGLINFLSYPDGTQINNGKEPDKNFNYNEVVIEDSFFMNNTELRIFIPDGKTQKIAPRILGKNNGFGLVDYSNANHLRPNSGHLISHVYLSDTGLKTTSSPFVFIPNSYQKMVVDNHSGEEIYIFNYIYFQSLFNLAGEENNLVSIRFMGEDNKGKSIESNQYLSLYHPGMSFLCNDDKETFIEINPALNPGKKTQLKSYFKKGQETASSPILVIENGDKSLKEARIKFINCQHIKSYTLECDIIKSGYQKLGKQEMRQKIELLENQKQTKR